MNKKDLNIEVKNGRMYIKPPTQKEVAERVLPTEEKKLSSDNKVCDKGKLQEIYASFTRVNTMLESICKKSDSPEKTKKMPKKEKGVSYPKKEQGIANLLGKERQTNANIANSVEVLNGRKQKIMGSSENSEDIWGSEEENSELAKLVAQEVGNNETFNGVGKKFKKIHKLQDRQLLLTMLMPDGFPNLANLILPALAFLPNLSKIAWGSLAKKLFPHRELIKKLKHAKNALKALREKALKEAKKAVRTSITRSAKKVIDQNMKQAIEKAIKECGEDATEEVLESAIRKNLAEVVEKGIKEVGEKAAKPVIDKILKEEGKNLGKKFTKEMSEKTSKEILNLVTSSGFIGECTSDLVATGAKQGIKSALKKLGRKATQEGIEKVAKKAGKAALEEGMQKLVTEMGEAGAKEAIADITARYGDEAAEKFVKVAAKKGANAGAKAAKKVAAQAAGRGALVLLNPILELATIGYLGSQRDKMVKVSDAQVEDEITKVKEEIIKSMPENAPLSDIEKEEYVNLKLKIHAYSRAEKFVKSIKSTGMDNYALQILLNADDYKITADDKFQAAVNWINDDKIADFIYRRNLSKLLVLTGIQPVNEKSSERGFESVLTNITDQLVMGGRNLKDLEVDANRCRETVKNYEKRFQEFKESQESESSSEASEQVAEPPMETQPDRNINIQGNEGNSETPDESDETNEQFYVARNENHAEIDPLGSLVASLGNPCVSNVNAIKTPLSTPLARVATISSELPTEVDNNPNILSHAQQNVVATVSSGTDSNIVAKYDDLVKKEAEIKRKPPRPREPKIINLTGEPQINTTSKKVVIPRDDIRFMTKYVG